MEAKADGLVVSDEKAQSPFEVGRPSDSDISWVTPVSQRSLSSQPIPSKPISPAKKEPYWFCDFAFLNSLLPKEMLTPVTRWKAAYFFCLFAVSGVIAWTNQYVNYVAWFVRAFKQEDDFLLAYTSVIDGLLVMAATAWATYEPALNPRAPKEEHPFGEDEQKMTCVIDIPNQLNINDVALVIPAYESLATIREVLDYALAHFSADQIIIVNNGNGQLPDLKRFLQDCGEPYDHAIVVDHAIGNKTYAQYIGTMIAAHKGYKAVMAIDDDVLLPRSLNVVNDLSMIKGNTCAVTYGLEPIVENKSSGWWGRAWVAMQRIEYLLSMQHKIFEQRAAGGVNFPPGAIILCRIPEFIHALKNVDCHFYGEDVKIGMQILYADKSIALSSQTVIQTRAPDSFAKLWKQRVASWDKVFYVNFFTLVITPLFKFRPDWRNNVSLKLIQIYMLHAVIANLIRVPLMVTFASQEGFWLRFGIYFAATLLPVIAWNNIKLSKRRKDLQSNLAAICVFPFYKALSHVFGLFAFLHTMFIHWPNSKRIATIPELKASGRLNVLALMRQHGIVRPASSSADHVSSRVSPVRPSGRLFRSMSDSAMDVSMGSLAQGAASVPGCVG